MAVARITVVACASLSASCIIAPFYFSQGGQSQPGSLDRLVADLPAVLLASAICGWPWWVALANSGSAEGKVGATVFACFSAIVALPSAFVIASAPSEGRMYYVAFYVLLSWVVGPLLLRIGLDSEP